MRTCLRRGRRLPGSAARYEANGPALNDSVDHLRCIENGGEDRPASAFDIDHAKDAPIGLARESLWWTVKEELSFTQQKDVIACLGFIEIRSGPNHTDAFVLESAHHAPKFATGDWIDAHARLVEQQQARLAHETHTQDQASASCHRRACRPDGP